MVRTMPTRQSSRLSGLSAVPTFEPKLNMPVKRAPAWDGPRPFKSDDDDVDKQMLDSIRNIKINESRQKAPAGSWFLTPDRVRKLTKDGITCLGFMDTSNALVLAAGDKQGNLTIWNSTLSACDEGSILSSFSDLHSEYISGLCWTGRNLITLSYDPLQPIRRFDPESSTFELHKLQDDIEISAGCVSSASHLYLGTNDGGLLGYDLRASAVTVAHTTVHQKRLNTVEASGHLILTSSSDTS